MSPRRLLSVSSSLLCASLLTACATSTATLYERQVDASLKLPCKPPAPLPELPSDNELSAFMIRQAQAFVDCSDRHAALVRVLDTPLNGEKK